MKRINSIIESEFAPASKNDMWLFKGSLKYFGPSGWANIQAAIEGSVDWDGITNKPNFATVATSGSYNDLSDKPDIPPAYTLPIASATVLGGVKSSTTGTTSGRDYNVEINADGTMKVNVPWTDNNTTYEVASASANGLMSSTDKSKLDGIADNANNYTLPNASASTRGGVLMAAAVADLAGTEDAAAICTKVNALLAALRTAGILTT